MNKITDAILKAQILLKDRADLKEILQVLAKFSKSSTASITPELQNALDTINRIYKLNIS